MTRSMLSGLDLHKKALLHAAADAPNVLVFGDTPPDEATHDAAYLIVDPDPGRSGVTRADGRVSSRSGSFAVRCCGSTPGQALRAVDAARIAFDDWRPYGLRYSAAVEVDSGPLLEDRSVPTSPRYSVTLSYEVTDD